GQSGTDHGLFSKTTVVCPLKYSQGNPAMQPRLGARLDRMEYLVGRKTPAVAQALTFLVTEVSRMKPFITPEISAKGQRVLRFQLEGFEDDLSLNSVRGHSIIAYGMPAGHTLETAWEFILIFEDGSLLEFSSACTQVIGWEEVGSLNIRFAPQVPGHQSSASEHLLRVEIQKFEVIAIKKLVYEDDDVIAECGLILYGANGEEVIVATGVSPGSVSIGAAFSAVQFKPEFPVHMTKRESI
ncbi:MAG: hypothetical protein LH618_02445, partial [Saprospiraceae bacterium]|nr:hypothetical protein [Saprospiraceae bacterium]